MSCYICGAPSDSKRICVTKQGKILCPDCFMKAVKADQRKRNHGREDTGQMPARIGMRRRQEELLRDMG